MVPREIAQVLAGERRFAIANADCLEALRAMPDDCVDSLVCDPPAGISFMSKKWDSDHGGRDRWVVRMAERFREACRVLKPGAHGLVWAIPRTAHWTAWSLEDAGFYVVDKQFHIFGSGFPKSVDVGRAIDRKAGAEREIIGVGAARCAYLERGEKCPGHGDAGQSQSGATVHSPATAPATDDARQWAGWGTALKPAVEEWILVRKPFKGTVVANVLEHGTGAINIDACRVSGIKDVPASASTRGGYTNGAVGKDCPLDSGGFDPNVGRWPANCLLSHSAGCERAGTKRVKAAPSSGLEHMPTRSGGEATGRVDGTDGLKFPRAGAGRNGGRANDHPTVKSDDLMRYLCRLITPPNGVCLDIFMGSGSTGKACSAEGFRFIGIELDAHYCDIARARICGENPLFNREVAR